MIINPEDDFKICPPFHLAKHIILGSDTGNNQMRQGSSPTCIHFEDSSDRIKDSSSTDSVARPVNSSLPVFLSELKVTCQVGHSDIFIHT